MKEEGEGSGRGVCALKAIHFPDTPTPHTHHTHHTTLRYHFVSVRRMIVPFCANENGCLIIYDERGVTLQTGWETLTTEGLWLCL